MANMRFALGIGRELSKVSKVDKSSANTWVQG